MLVAVQDHDILGAQLQSNDRSVLFPKLMKPDFISTISDGTHGDLVEVLQEPFGNGKLVNVPDERGRRRAWRKVFGTATSEEILGREPDERRHEGAKYNQHQARRHCQIFISDQVRLVRNVTRRRQGADP